MDLLNVKFVLIGITIQNSETAWYQKLFVNIVTLGSKPSTIENDTWPPERPEKRKEKKTTTKKAKNKKQNKLSHELTGPILWVSGDPTSRYGALTGREVPILVLVATGLLIRFYPPHHLSS